MSHAARRETSDQIWLVLESIAAAQPELQMKDGVLLAQKVYREVTWMREQGISSPPPPAGPTAPMPNPADQVAFGRWANENVMEIRTHLADGKPIQAIKALRTATGCGLKESKEAIDWIRAKNKYSAEREA